MATNLTKPNPEVQTARDWYIYLWISPVFTIPTLFFILSNIYEGEPWNMAAKIVLGSAMWHLILLYPAIGGKTDFVRWHGRQALLLASLRTAAAFGAVGLIFQVPFLFFFCFLLLCGLWLAGNLWGQGQAKRGDCALMRWTGHGAGLPRPIGWKVSPLEPAKTIPDPEEIDKIVGVIRFNTDPKQRRAALAELERLGLVEAL